MFKLFLLLGSCNAFLAVILGAFGAHGLKDKISPEMILVYQTGVQYQMFHALALILIALLCKHIKPSSILTWAGWLIFAGIVFFSGSLYVLSMSGLKALGMITPFGGVAFLMGWAMLAVAVWKQS